MSWLGKKLITVDRQSPTKFVVNCLKMEAFTLVPFTPSESRSESEKDLRKNDKHKIKFSLSLPISLGMNEPYLNKWWRNTSKIAFTDVKHLRKPPSPRRARVWWHWCPNFTMTIKVKICFGNLIWNFGKLNFQAPKFCFEIIPRLHHLHVHYWDSS